MTEAQCKREFEFSLITGCGEELSEDMIDRLHDVGCDDATPYFVHGQVRLEFARSDDSLLDAILSAIREVKLAGIGPVLYVNECNLVTQAEIARRIRRSRQVVQQYIAGVRGHKGFPSPVCYLGSRMPLWAWCDVSNWLLHNNLMNRDDRLEAQVVAIVNNSLERNSYRSREPKLFDQVEKSIASKDGD